MMWNSPPGGDDPSKTGVGWRDKPPTHEDLTSIPIRDPPGQQVVVSEAAFDPPGPGSRPIRKASPRHLSAGTG